MDSVTRLGVVGCGLMGSGIAEVAARSGIDVRVAEATHDAVEAGRRRLTASSTGACGVASSARNNETRPSPGSPSPVTSATWPTASSSSRP